MTKKDTTKTTPLEMVKHFKKVTQQEGTPELYIELISEEFLEFMVEQVNPNGDPQAELKELADLVYVIYGYALSRGWNLDEALLRVHENNLGRMYQEDGTIKRREDGKIMKNKDFPKVELGDLV